MHTVAPFQGQNVSNVSFFPLNFLNFIKVHYVCFTEEVSRKADEKRKKRKDGKKKQNRGARIHWEAPMLSLERCFDSFEETILTHPLLNFSQLHLG